MTWGLEPESRKKIIRAIPLILGMVTLLTTVLAGAVVWGENRQRIVSLEARQSALELGTHEEDMRQSVILERLASEIAVVRGQTETILRILMTERNERERR